MSKSRIFSKILAGLFFTIYSSVAVATEEPKFNVVQKYEDFEIREYGPTIVAETVVDANFEDAGNKAFNILAGYIFGDNKTKAKIEMTAPVSQVPAKGHVVQFTMPASFTMETLPVPNDSRVQLRTVPGRKVAVFRYSGSWSQSRYKEKLAEFVSALEKEKVATIGEPVFARFNSPFRIWFLRRNEIWLQVAP